MQTIEAVYTGTVLQLDGPLDLEPNTRVRVIVEELEPEPGQAGSFLRTARSLNLVGPPDWATNWEEYLHPAPKTDG